jgi:hypothetical protein
MMNKDQYSDDMSYGSNKNRSAANKSKTRGQSMMINQSE